MIFGDADQQQNSGNKIVLFVGIGILLCALIASGFWLMREEYGVLFSDLNAQDAAAVISSLEKEKIPYRVAGAGDRILVPKGEVHTARIKLMGSDLPLRGGVGFEIFDDSNFGVTEFAQRVNFQRALQGELTRTIIALEEVKYARLHLVLPENSLFKKTDKPASASVTLFLHHNLTPNEAQIAGIQRLIAASVSGMSPSDVTVINESGKALSQISGGEGSSMASVQLQQKQSVEKYLMLKAEKILHQIFDHAQSVAVTVDVEIDFTQSTINQENVIAADTPTKGLTRKRESGMPANDKEKSSRIVIEEEYAVGRSVSQIVQQGGQIKRINAAVVVPKDTDDTTLSQIRNLLNAALGIDNSRGDTIAIFPLNRRIANEDSLQFTNFIPEPPPRELLASSDFPTIIPKASADSPRYQTLTDETSPANATPDVLWRAFFSEYPGQIFLGMCMLSTLLAVLFILGRRSAATGGTEQLSHEEREKLLGILRDWLEEPTSGRERGTG